MDFGLIINLNSTLHALTNYIIIFYISIINYLNFFFFNEICYNLIKNIKNIL